MSNSSASGPVLELLSRDYEIADIEALPLSPTATPIVIGPGGLADPDIMAQVVAAYEAGLTVAITGATQNEADRFGAFVEGERLASCSPAKRKRVIALYALQHELTQQPPVQSRYCLPEFDQAPRRAVQRARKWLEERFATTPTAPPRQRVATLRSAASKGNNRTPAGSVNLDSLASKIHCSAFTWNNSGQVQADLFLTSMRNFNQQQDYYYGEGFFQFVPTIPNYRFGINISRPHETDPDADDLLGTRLLFTEPNTTTAAVSQYTNSKSTTVSTAVGYGVSAGNQGFDLSYNVEQTTSVTAGTETTVTVPPVTIDNDSDLRFASASWSFQPATLSPNKLYSVSTSALWIVPKAVYPDGGENPNQLLNIAFVAGILDPDNTVVSVADQCGLATPFQTWTVTAPEVASVTPVKVKRGGGVFEIVGHQLYPSIVADLLLGGNPLPAANFVPIDDNHVRVVVPGGQKTGLTPVQVNTLFNGKTLPSNNDVKVDIQR